jgi:hypothetical protein
MALTPKQEKFCQSVASGMSYKDAYINAYDCKDTGRTALNEGSKLALRDDIQARITTLLKPVQQAAKIQGLNAREEQLQFITDRIKVCQEKEDEQSLIRWMDMKNKLLQLYSEPDDKKENDNNLTNINTDVLAKIVKIG